MFNYKRFKEAYYILENDNLTKQEKDDKLFTSPLDCPQSPSDDRGLKNQIIPENYISPIWNKASLPLTSVNDIKDVISKAWLVGFIERRG